MKSYYCINDWHEVSQLMYRLSKRLKEEIATNMVAFMVDDTPLLKESISFIYNWVSQPEGVGRSKGYYDVWDIVLRNYLPKERPTLFRSCKRLSNRPIQSFTGKIYTAERFSDGHTGHLLICDTKEYLQSENETAEEHKRSFFSLYQCVEKAMTTTETCFSEYFYVMCKKEDEYIVRVNQDWLYDLKWNKKR